MLVVASIVFLAVAAGAPMRASYWSRTTADEPHYLLTAISLGEDGDLDVSDERTDVRYLPFSEVPPLVQATIQADGTQVEPHDPLLPALLALPMRLGGWVAAKLALAAMAAAVAALTCAVAVRRFDVSLRVAAVTAVVAGASPPLSVYGTQVYPEIAGALCVVAALWASTGPRTPRTAALTAACVAALPWLSVKYAPVAAVLAAAALVPLLVGPTQSLRRAGALLAWFALAGVTFLVAHHAWYGGWTAYASGSHFAEGELTVMGDPDYVGRAQRITGLLLDRHFGLAVWQPAALALPLALVAWLRRRPQGWLTVVAALAAGWATATFVALTMHGWWWPGRQVVVVLPAAVLVVAWWADRLAPGLRRVLAVAGGLGVAAHAVLVGAVLAGRHTLVVDFDRTPNPFVRGFRLLLPDLRHPGAGTVVVHGVWVAVLAAGCWWAWRQSTGARSRGEEPRDQPAEPASSAVDSPECSTASSTM